MDIYNFDPVFIGKNDAKIWKEYYSRNFLGMGKIVFMNFKKSEKKNYFRFMLLIVCVILSSVVFVYDKYTNKRNSKLIILFLAIFIWSLQTKRSINYFKAAKKMYMWWLIDRLDKSKKSERRRKSIRKTLSYIYGIPEINFRTYAENWEDAALIFDKYDKKEAQLGDWNKCEKLLVTAYSSLHKTINVYN